MADLIQTDSTAPRDLVSLVVPVFNEEAAMSDFFARVPAIMQGIAGIDYEIVFVNDGSTDRSLDDLLHRATSDNRLVVIELSRNFGKEAALTAGIDLAKGTVVIPFDADLQDPPEVIPALISKWREGYDVVLAKRAARDTDTLLKRRTAAAFYALHNRISDFNIPDDVGDFRLMSRPAVEALRQLPENRRFMKGLFAWVGFKTACIEYRREPRSAGKTKFSGWKLWNFALEGITSFSTLPLRIWTYLGSCTALSAIIYAVYLLIRTLVHGRDIPGYASLITAILFLGGVQLIGIGVVGEYIGRIYLESKRRPVYIVRQIHGGGH